MTERSRRQRRVGLYLALVAVVCLSLWAIFLLPQARSVAGNRATRTSYGVTRWMEVTHSRIEPIGITELLVPGNRLAPQINAGRTILAVACTAGLAVFLVGFTRRALSNLSPRSQCSHCGYRVTGSSTLENFCPECGRLPNLKRDPWAVWR